MELHAKIKAIRELLDVSQKVLSIEMKVNPSFISKLESGSKPISSETLKKIRKTLNIEDVPLSDDEIQEFMTKLQSWRDLINDRRLGEAIEIQPKLARCSELSLNSEIQVLYTLYSVGYFRSIGDTASSENAILFLDSMQDSLSPSYLLGYLILKGNDALNNGDYKIALKDLLAAEKINMNLNIAHGGLFFSIAACLSSMGYSYKAEEYIKKARKRSEEIGEKSLEMHYSINEALCCKNTGRYDEALRILSGCLRYGKSKADSGLLEGIVNHNIGCVYLKQKEYAVAIEYFEKASQSFKKSFKKESESFINNLYFKAIALLSDNRIDEGMRCIEEGLSTVGKHGFLNILFNALKCSLSLCNDSSLEYIERIAMTKFLKTGRYLEVIEYSDILTCHYRSIKKYKQALKFSEMSQKYYKIITEGEICLD